MPLTAGGISGKAPAHPITARNLHNHSTRRSTRGKNLHLLLPRPSAAPTSTRDQLNTMVADVLMTVLMGLLPLPGRRFMMLSI